MWLKFHRSSIYLHICVEYYMILIFYVRGGSALISIVDTFGGHENWASYNIYTLDCDCYIYVERICWTSVIVLWKLGKAYCLTSGDKRAGVHNVREGRIKRGRATYWSSMVRGVWEVEGGQEKLVADEK